MALINEEEELRKKLLEIQNNKKAAEVLEKKAELDAAFERCSTSEYVKNLSDYPHYITLRKISNLEHSTELGGCVKVHVHEEVRIMFRVRDEKSRFNGTIIGTDVHACYEKSADMRTKSGFIQKDDFPISKEEFEKGREFAELVALTADKFITDNPFLSK